MSGAGSNAHPSRMRRVGISLGGLALAIIASAVVVVFAPDLEAFRSRIPFIPDANKPKIVEAIDQGSTFGGNPQQRWTIPVPEGQTLIVSAFTARIEREDGSVLENSSPDRLLFALEGEHTYVMTLTNGQWKTVKAEDGQREFCYEKAAHEHKWGARYAPRSWPTNVCDQFGP